MNELQAAIEAAGLPEVAFDYQRLSYCWKTAHGAIELRKEAGLYRVRRIDGWAVLADIPGIPTPAEACAKVKEWMG